MKPPCLAVARHLGYVTDTEVAYVLAIQEYCVWMRGQAKGKALELAAAIGYLAKEKIPAILERQKELETSNTVLRDPMTAVRRNPGRVAITRSGKKLIAGLTLLVVVVTAVLTRGDIAAIAAIGTITALITGSLAVFLSAQSKWTVRLTCAIELLLFLTPAILLVYSVYVACNLTEPAIVRHPWVAWLLAATLVRLLVSLFLLGVSAACFGLLAYWRRLVLISQREQLRLLGNLVAESRARVTSTRSNGSKQGVLPAECVRETLKATVELLSENRWASSAAGFLAFLGYKAAGTISVWYLAPNESEKRFNIECYATSDLPNDRVRDAFNTVGDKHRPMFMDRGRYKSIVQAAKAAHGDDWRDVVGKQLHLDQYVSLTGYVAGTSVPVVCDDADACPVFRRRDYLKLLGDGFDDVTRSWLDFRCFGAYPIMATGNGSFEPAGVLVVFRNMKNSLSCTDVDALNTVAHLLALGCCEDGRQTHPGE